MDIYKYYAKMTLVCEHPKYITLQPTFTPLLYKQSFKDKKQIIKFIGIIKSIKLWFLEKDLV